MNSNDNNNHWALNHNPSKEKKTSFWYDKFLKPIEYHYMQFLLITTLYVMEPWERLLIMIVLLLVFSLVTYSAWAFVPYHLQQIYRVTKSPMTSSLFF